MKASQLRLVLIVVLTIASTGLISACSSKENIHNTNASVGKSPSDAPQNSALNPTGSFTKKVLTEKEQAKVNKSLVEIIHNYDQLSLDDKFTAVRKAVVEDQADVNSLNQFGEPILGDAIHYGDGSGNDPRVIEFLIENGADVNAFGEETKRSPLTKAATAGDLNTIRMMQNHGLRLDNDNASRAIIKAAFYQNFEIVDLLIAGGVTPSNLYKKALLEGTRSQETHATAALFGAYADLRIKELEAIIGKNQVATTNALASQVWSSVAVSCKKIDEISSENTLKRYTLQAPFVNECTEMAKLDSVRFMHCFGLLEGKTASLQRLQLALANAIGHARSEVPESDRPFAEITELDKLEAKTDAIHHATDLYKDVIGPLSQTVKAKLQHHYNRNLELQTLAKGCEEKEILSEAKNIHSSLQTVSKSMEDQSSGWQNELKSLHKAGQWLRYQHPALMLSENLEIKEADDKEKGRLAQKTEDEQSEEQNNEIETAEDKKETEEQPKNPNN